MSARETQQLGHLHLVSSRVPAAPPSQGAAFQGAGFQGGRTSQAEVTKTDITISVIRPTNILKLIESC